MQGKKVQAPHEDVTYRVIGAAMSVHRRIGPGQKEVIYQRALEREFAGLEVAFIAEPQLPVWEDEHLLGFYIPDFVVEDKVIVELKAFAALPQKYLGQVVTYLNHTGLEVGLLLNFGARSMLPRRVFPSRSGPLVKVDYRWLFVPTWLREQNQSA